MARTPETTTNGNGNKRKSRAGMTHELRPIYLVVDKQNPITDDGKLNVVRQEKDLNRIHNEFTNPNYVVHKVEPSKVGKATQTAEGGSDEAGAAEPAA